jgi:hypothetical protein
MFILWKIKSLLYKLKHLGLLIHFCETINAGARRLIHLGNYVFEK